MHEDIRYEGYNVTDILWIQSLIVELDFIK